ncbi:hypothetical protein [Azospirillum melinis]
MVQGHASHAEAPPIAATRRRLLRRMANRNHLRGLFQGSPKAKSINL